MVGSVQTDAPLLPAYPQFGGAAIVRVAVVGVRGRQQIRADVVVTVVTEVADGIVADVEGVLPTMDPEVRADGIAYPGSYATSTLSPTAVATMNPCNTSPTCRHVG